ncbi:RNA polymerase sigma factor SigJ [Nocardia sp. NPDC127526]|uniref:RNA polymerase sigma factor SigJ n=1 Tax=Nocardia sp. NPDC127526 TaxID=3345393 RepID=UPI0036384DBD
MSLTSEPGGPRCQPADAREATATFLAHRRLLFTVAYEMLGSAADSEDMLQKTWLRWHTVDLDQVTDARAYLVRTVTRLSLDHLRSSNRRSEAYVGPWLPEPLSTAPDAAHDLALADSLSMALMLCLETLTPTERAVYVLRDAFDLGYDEIADTVGRPAATVRQIALRARRHIAVRRPHRTVSAEVARTVTESVRRALETGDSQALLAVLAPDAVLISDGGGFKRAAVRPITSAAKVVRFITGGLGKRAVALTCEPVTINGNAALAVHVDGEFDGILALGIDGEHVTGLYFVRNPAKSTHTNPRTR